jgi:hypothetical protein
MPIKKLLSLTACSIFLLPAFAQTGGNSAYKFLNLHPSARVAALGGNLNCVYDNDVNLALQNPALLNKSMNKQVAFNISDYLADITTGYVAAAKHYDSIGTFSASLLYVNYGSFIAADNAGNITGTFKAGDYAFIMGYGNTYKSRFSYGASLKFIYSSLAEFNSVGIAADIGGTYFNASKLVTASLVIRNIGTQITTYAGTREPLPFGIEAGVSLKPEHAPLRFSLVAHNLQKFDLSHINPHAREKIISLETQEEIPQKVTFGTKVLQHCIIGTEFLISKSVNIRLGYNSLRRSEMALSTRSNNNKQGMVGFSFGMGVRINRFHLSYGRSSYHLANAINQFSVVTNLGDFRKKHKKGGSITPTF